MLESNRGDTTGTLPDALDLQALVTELRAKFEKDLERLDQAQTSWGIRAGEPEAVFISSMIGTMRGFVETALALGGGLQSVVVNARALSAVELEKQREATEQFHRTLLSADRTLEASCRQADLKLRRVETDTVRLAGELVEKMVPLSLKALRDAVTIREIRVNRDLEWRRWGIAAACALGVFLLGFAACDYKGWDDFRQASVARAALTLCMHAPQVLDAAQNRYCLMTLFVPK